MRMVIDEIYFVYKNTRNEILETKLVKGGER